MMGNRKVKKKKCDTEAIEQYLPAKTDLKMQREMFGQIKGFSFNLNFH